MRIIKLSSKDDDMKTPEMVKDFFRKKLPHRPVPGQFFFKKNLIAEGGLFPGEGLLFTYESQCVYEARSTTGRLNNEDHSDSDYPFYFCVDVDSIAALSGTLKAFEQKLIQIGLHNGKNIAASQAWLRIEETEAFRSHIDSILNEFRQENQQ